MDVPRIAVNANVALARRRLSLMRLHVGLFNSAASLQRIPVGGLRHPRAEAHMTTVLVVDDEEAIRDAVCTVLEDAGFACQQAANGEEALAVMHASKDPLVVLLDVMMPRMSGLDLLGIVAVETGLVGRHTVILLTALDKNLPLALSRLIDRLGVLVLGKPFDVDLLVEAVTHAAKRLAGA